MFCVYSGSNTFGNLIAHLHDASIDITSPSELALDEEINNNANYLLLDISFENLFESLLKSMQQTVNNGSAFNIDRYTTNSRSDVLLRH